jgi:hypothetical protein
MAIVQRAAQIKASPQEAMVLFQSDRTRLTTTFDYAHPGGVFGTLADALLVKRFNG